MVPLIVCGIRDFLKKLQSSHTNGNILSLHGECLYGHALREMLYGTICESQPTDANVPQDSALGPLIWNVYSNDPNLLMIAPYPSLTERCI